MQGLRRGLSADLFEFQELGRKLLLSIDRSVLVDLPPDFYYDVHKIEADLDSLATTLTALSHTQGKISSLRDAQRDFKEKQKKKIETTKNVRNRDLPPRKNRVLKQIWLPSRKILCKQLTFCETSYYG